MISIKDLGRFVALLFCGVIIINATTTARAEDVRYKDIKQVSRAKQDGRQSPALRLSKKSGKNKSKTEQLARHSSKEEQPPLLPKSDVVAQGACSSSNVEQIELCDLTGTVCEDCGEVVLISEVLPAYAEVPNGGGFPKFPFLALAAAPIPFLFHHGGDQTPRVTTPLTPGIPGGEVIIPVIPPIVPPTTVEPQPNPVPEPTTLLLFGSGITALWGAATRRKRRRMPEGDGHVTATSSGEVLR